MVLSKITVDNSVRFNPITEKTKGRDSKTETIKTGSLPRKQNKKLSQNNKKINKNVAAGGFVQLYY